jgi:hypothetical protein
MSLIIISLFFIILFGFLGALNLSYAIYSWEKNRVEEMTKNFMPQESNNLMATRAEYSSSIQTKDTTKFKKKMKIPKKIEDFYNSSMVVLSQQDYKGWLDKIVFNFKKITSNLGLYTKYSFNYVVNLIKKSDDTAIEETKVEIDNSVDINETIQKVKSISKNKQEDAKSEYINITENKIDEKKPKNATIDMASDDTSDKLKRDKNVYNQLEDLILEKLKTNGMDCWPVWMELAAHYEKYKEFDKAVEIFAMVMKNSKGPEKNIAKDKLIALS